MSRDLQSLKLAIACVELRKANKEPKGMGTAFYVGDGYALSALHVVADYVPANPGSDDGQTPPELWLNFTTAGQETRATPIAEDRVNDWVFLKCDQSPTVEPIECAELPAEGAEWKTFGYPDFKPVGHDDRGTVNDPRAEETKGKPPQKISAIHLSTEAGKAGQGAPLNGFSGAPCLVGGKAVGLLRSNIVEMAIDGSLKTVAGAVFACPASVIVDRAAPHDRIRLPGGWSRPLLASDFLVITSTREQEADQRLEDVAINAHTKLGQFNLGVPYVLDAENQIVSLDALMNVVELLCKARVAVFDATQFEPAVMLLLGIRAAVRRGVTILSIGENYKLGDRIEVPFNLLDANIVSHSTTQEEGSIESMKPIPLLTARIERGLRDIGSPHYFDLPVYEALRRLPAQRRSVRPPEDGVLVLCSFASDYTDRNWEKSLRRALFNQLDTLRKDPNRGWKEYSGALGVARSFELNSPQLVSRAIYEEIRRAQACIVDLTGWPANVLFELGVRLAVSKYPTACLIEQKEDPKKGLEKQCDKLLALLVPAEQRYDVEKNYLKEQAYARVYGPKAVLPTQGITGGDVYRRVEKNIQVDGEPAARPVYRELLDSAQLFARFTGGGSQKQAPVGLFPTNKKLTDFEEQADFERLLAAWLFLVHRYGEDTVLKDEESELGKAVREALKGLFAERHKDRIAKLDKSMVERLNAMQEKVENMKKQLRAAPTRTIGEER
jgi:hypothetical protein